VDAQVSHKRLFSPIHEQTEILGLLKFPFRTQAPSNAFPSELTLDEAEFLCCSREAQKQRETTELEAARTLAQEQKQRAELLQQREKEQKAVAKKLRRSALTASSAAATAMILLTMFVVKWRAAREQAQIAESRRLAAESSSVLTRYPQRSLLLAVEAVKILQPLDGVRVTAAEQALREALSFIGGRPLVVSQSTLSAVTISADNHWLVAGTSDGTVRLWDLRAQAPNASPFVLRGHERWIAAVGISPNGHWLVTGSEDKTARLWQFYVNDFIKLTRAAVGRNFSVNEWQLYFPGEPYRKTFAELPGSDGKAAE
jgi:hypothetical protein